LGNGEEGRREQQGQTKRELKKTRNKKKKRTGGEPELEKATPNEGRTNKGERERQIRTDDIIPWDKEFCNVDQPTLFEMILAANYLDIKPLLDLTCKTVANMIKGKTPEEIRKTFGVNQPFTPEEEEQVIKLPCVFR